MATKAKKPKLNKNAALWVKALRSGEYKQTKLTLRHRGSYCCLGVACDLYCMHVKNIKDARLNKYDGERAVLPVSVMKWIGLKTTKGQYGLGRSLVFENDHGRSFAQIADIIESKPKGLFVEDK